MHGININQRLAFKELKKIERSMLPPEIIAATFLPLNLASFFIAANTNAPESYTIIFILY